MNWQPIETAPRDGVFILLGYAGSHTSEGRWVGDPSRNHWGETGWFETDEDVLCEHPSEPTHWMPIPQPPELPRYEVTDAGRDYLKGKGDE